MMLRRLAMALCVVSLVLSAAGVASAALAVPSITPLGVWPLGFAQTLTGAGVNSAGQVVGNGYWTAYLQNPWVAHGFYYDTNGPLADIGNISAPPFTSIGDYLSRGATDNAECQPKGINATGVATGYSAYAGAGSPVHAFTYTAGGGFVDLGTLAGAAAVSRAYAINDSGQVTGSSYYPGGGTATHAMLYSGGTMYDIGTLAGATTGIALAINASGTIAGASQVSGVNHGFLWTPTTPNGTTGSMIDIGSLGTNLFTVPYGINDAGKVVGRAMDSGGVSHAFLWSSGSSMVALDSLPTATLGWAYDIDNHDRVVGYCDVSGANRATIWTSDDPHDLFSLLPAGLTGAGKWTELNRATAISDNGWVTGIGVYNSVTQPFRLRVALPGDANYDSKVDINDLTKVLTNYNQSTGANGWDLGDFNGDNKVDINDLTIVLANYNQSLGSSVGMAAVPEPTSLLLAVAGALGLLAHAWWKRK
jgi:probable HAF family extracellular repeat protein